MTSLLAGPRAASPPRFHHVPDYGSSAGDEAIELAATAGLILDAHQQLVLRDALGERPDGSWAAFEVGLVEPRQNGKDSIVEARELAGLFLFGERLLTHSAHQFDTSLEHFGRLLFLIENTPDFDRRVARVSRSHGEEGITLKGGQRIRFRTRTMGGGRGFSGDLLVYNEAMILREASHGSLLPTLSARENPQVWYLGSPVDQEIHEHGFVLARIRERGLKGEDQRLAYFEWSAPFEHPNELDDGQKVDDGAAADPAIWAQANPALGIRISAEHVELERQSMDARTFAVERLGVGDWPSPDGASSVIDQAKWAALADPSSTMLDPVWLAFDVTPDRSWASIGAAGQRPDGLAHVEVVDRRRGTGWVVERLLELVEKHAPAGIVVDGRGPASSLLPELEAGLEGGQVEVTIASTADHASGCGLLFDRVEQATVRHLGTAEVAAALRGATKRPLGDAWAWSRKSSAVDISPLVACTLALWASDTLGRAESVGCEWF